MLFCCVLCAYTVERIPLGGPCSAGDQCASSNSGCIAGRCDCLAGYVIRNRQCGQYTVLSRACFRHNNNNNNNNNNIIIGLIIKLVFNPCATIRYDDEYLMCT